MAGLTYAVGGALWFVVLTAIVARFGGDAPPGTSAFYLAELVWLVVQALLLVGFFGLLWSGAVGRHRFGRIAFGVGALGHALFVAAEIHALVIGSSSDLWPVAALVSALGLVLVGIAVLGAREWRGWTRWVPLVTGAYFFVGMVPFVFLTDQPNAFAIGAWGLLRLVLGLAMWSEARVGNRGTVVGAAR